jgi:outer membrane protein OmpA-like peptidoglycan-associated protein
MKLYSFKNYFSIGLLLLASSNSFGQQLDKMNAGRNQFGIYGNYNENFHQTDARGIPGVPTCCPRYDGGSGSGMSIGGLYQIPYTDQIMLDLRLGYSNFSGSLTATEEREIRLEDNSIGKGKFKHTLITDIATIGIEPMVGYNIWKSMFLKAGLQLGFLVQNSFEQREERVSNEEGTYTYTGGEPQQSGDITEASSFQSAILAGVSYDLPLTSNQSLSIAPELYYSYQLTDLLQNEAWNISSLRLGFALKYMPVEPPPPEPIIPVKEPVIEKPVVVEAPKPLPQLNANVNVLAVDNSGSTRPLDTLKIEEFLSQQLRPLLPYVFFDNNSTEFGSRYIQISALEAQNFTMSELLGKTTLETYYHTLNVIGKRLTENPNARITVSGYKSQTEDGASITMERAKTVADYFKNVWKIDNRRISVEGKNLPAKPSNEETSDGIEENRRVEITSNVWDITSPILVRDTVRTSNNSLLRFQHNILAEAGLRNGNLTVKQNNVTLESFPITSASGSADWEITEDLKAEIQANSTLTYALEVNDASGQSFTTPLGYIPSEKITVQMKKTGQAQDRNIDRYSLILFDFNKSELSKANERIIPIIKRNISDNSVISITGYADRSGIEEYNARLSLQRAQSIAKALNKGNIQIVESPRGSALYDNTLPEGRFFSRTVEVIVETPVE